MMTVYSELEKNPKRFQNITGLSLDQFETLFLNFQSHWETKETYRLKRPTRQRAIGAGRRYKLSLKDRLLAVIVWNYKQLTPNAIGKLFSIHTSTAIRNRERVSEVLGEFIDLSFPDPGKGLNLSDCSDCLYLYELVK